MLVPPPVNSEFGVGDPFVSPDEKYVVFSSRRPSNVGAGDLFVAFRRADGGWDEPVHLGKTVNSAQTDFCPFVTPDGKYFFFSRRHRDTKGTVTAGDVYWVDAKFLEQFRGKELQREGGRNRPSAHSDFAGGAGWRARAVRHPAARVHGPQGPRRSDVAAMHCQPR